MSKRLYLVGFLMLFSICAGMQSMPAQRSAADEISDLEYAKLSFGEWIELCRQKLDAVEKGREIIWPAGGNDILEWKFQLTSEVEKELRAKYLERLYRGEAEAYRKVRGPYRPEVEKMVKEHIKELVRKSIELSYRLDAAKQWAIDQQTSLTRRIETMRADAMRRPAATRGVRPKLTRAELIANKAHWDALHVKWLDFNCNPSRFGCQDQLGRASKFGGDSARREDDPAKAQVIKIWLSPCCDKVLMNKPGPGQSWDEQKTGIDRCFAGFWVEIDRVNMGGEPRPYEAR